MAAKSAIKIPTAKPINVAELSEVQNRKTDIC